MQRHRMFLAAMALYLLACSLGTLLYLCVGRDFIALSYETESGGLLSHSLRFRDANSLEYYFQRAETIISGFWLLAAVVPLVYFPARKGYWLTALLIGDFAFIMLSGFARGPFNIDSDWALPEIFQYGKEFSVVLLLLVVYRVWHYRTLRCLACIFAFFLLDDSLQYHERVGAFLSGVLISLPGGSETRQNIGEALALVIPALVLGLLVVYSYVRDGVDGRRIFRKFLTLIAVFAFCGVFVDMALKSVVSASMEPSLTIVEDGGEMVIMTLFVVYAIHLWRVALNLPQPTERAMFLRAFPSRGLAAIGAR